MSVDVVTTGDITSGRDVSRVDELGYRQMDIVQVV
jgi:hypothetical protein